MNKNVKGAAVVIAVAAVAFTIYKLISKRKPKTDAEIIKANGHYQSDISNLSAFDPGFLKVWAQASAKREPTFTYDGKTYSTQGGKAV